MAESRRYEYFVFITNERRGEFSRYSVHDDERVDKIICGKYEVQYKLYADDTSTRIVIDAEDIKKELSSAIEYVNSTFVEKPDQKMLDAVIDQDEGYDHYVAKTKDAIDCLVGIVAKIAAKESKRPRLLESNATWFIHWGGGKSTTISEKERKLTNIFKSLDSYVNWSAYSLSSLRKTIFDVTASKIKVPDLAGLHRLKLRLAMSSDDIFAQLQVACGILSDADCKNIQAALNVVSGDQKTAMIEKIGSFLGNDGREGEIKGELVKYISAFPFSNDDRGTECLDKLGLLLSKLMKGEW